MNQLKKFLLILIFIFVFGLILRFMFLHQSPPSANWDEAAMGYNAYSLLLTGRDEYGHALPLVFRSFDDYKPPLYPYLTVLWVFLLDLNETSARATAALTGSLNVLLLGILIRKITTNYKIALLSALVLATAPVLVNFSRMAFEANLALTFFLLGLSLSWHKPALRTQLISLLLIAMSSFSYNSHKVYLLLFIFWMFIRFRQPKFVLGGIFVALLTFSGQASSRFTSTSIFSVWNGNVYEFISQIVNRYWSYFNPVLLFARGSDEPSQHVIGTGLFMVFMGPFFFTGLYKIFKTKTNKSLKYWLLLSPLPAVITWSWFSPIRVLPFWLFCSLCIALGIHTILKKRVILITVSILWVISTINLVFTLRYKITYLEYGNWQWGFRETIKAISPILENYQQVVWETPQAQPHIFVLFYSKYPPHQYHQDITWLRNDLSARKNFNFNKFTFRKTYWPDDRDVKNTLFIGTAEGLKESDITRDKRDYLDIYDPQGYITQRIIY